MLKLREMRESRGILQKTLAEILNRTQTCISDWERGRTEPSTNDLCLLANYFQCSIDELLGREDYVTGNVVIQGAQLNAFDERLLQVVHMLTLEDQYQVLGFAQALAK